MSSTLAPEEGALLSYLPRLARDWAAEPDRRHRIVEGSLVFADLSGFTAMTERLAKLGRRGAEDVSAIISQTFATMLTEAYRAGGSLLKFGGDALLLMFEGDEHARDAAWGAWGMRRALRRGGSFETRVGRIRLGMTSAIASGPIHVFMIGGDQKELLVAGETVSTLMDLEQQAGKGETLLSSDTARHLPAGSLTTDDRGYFRLTRRPPEVGLRDPEAPVPSAPITSFVTRAVRHRHERGDTTLEHRHIAVGFVGISGLDGLIDQNPEQAADSLDLIVTATDDSARQHGAWLLASDVAPDGAKLIVTAGAPVATGHDEAALLLTLHRLLQVDSPLEIRLGANHGTIFFGDIGPDYRRTLTVMGDTVNTAARLMGAAPADAILAARTMLDSRRARFDHRGVRELSLRGRKAPLEVAEVTGVAATAATSGSDVLVGRDAELERLDALVERTSAGDGEVVEVIGPPGSGRSRLLDRFLDRHPDISFARVEATLSERSVPYAIVRRLFEQLSGIDTAAPGAARQIEAGLRRDAPDLVDDVAFIARALGISGVDETALEQVDRRYLAAVTTRAVARLLESSAHRPFILVVDDVHLSDSASLEILRRLASRAGQLGWLLVLTAPEPPALEGSGDREVLELGPLDDAVVRRLALDLTDDRPLSSHELAEVVKRAGGNPLALREILSARRQGVDVDSIPSAVEGLAAMRIDQLDSTRSRQLETAAVLGVTFDPSVYEAVAERSGGEPLREIDDDFLEPTQDGRIRFKNPLIRDVIYNRLPFSHRTRLHAAVARSLVDRDASPDELAEHLFRAEQWTEAFATSLRAAEVADRRFANMEAVHWFELALECGRHTPTTQEERRRIWFALGELKERAGLYGEAQVAFLEAERLTSEPVEKARTMIRRARMHEQLGAYAVALRALTRARNLAPDTPDVVATTTARYGGIRFLQGKHDRAVALTEQALAATGGEETQSAEALALMISDMARASAGEAIDGSASRRALEIFDRLGDLQRQARVTNNLGMFAFFDGDWAEAARLYSDSRRTFERIGDEVNASYGANNLAEIWLLQGRYEQAEELFREVRRIWRAADDRYGAAYIEGQLGLIAAYTGRMDEAERYLQASIDQFEAIGARAEITEAGVHLVETRLLAADPAGAREVARTFDLEDAGSIGPRMVRLAATLEWQERNPSIDRMVADALADVVAQGSDIDELRLLELSARSGLSGADPERQAEITRHLDMVVSPVYPAPT